MAELRIEGCLVQRTGDVQSDQNRLEVLWLSNETPDRLGQGGQRRQYFQISALVEAGHHVTVVTLSGPQSHVEVSRIAPIRRTSPKIRGRITNPRHSSLMRDLARRDWDRVILAHSESWPTWRPLLDRLDAPLLVDMHNVLSAWHRQREDEVLAARWASIEKEIASASDVISVCSEREATRLEVPNLLIAEHGVDPREWTPEPSPAVRPIVKLFGNWEWAPNRSGLEWFLHDVWPGLPKTSQLECEVAGHGAHQVVGPHGTVAAVGRVPDLAGWLADAWIVAVPVIDGVGAPVKFAEALATGVPVVSTLDGVSTKRVKPCLTSDDPSEWVQRITEVVNDPAPWAADARRARAKALTDLAWTSVSSPLVDWVSTPR